MNPAAFRRTSESSDKWRGKVAQALATTPHSPRATPDWLSDVQQTPDGQPAPANVPNPPTPALPVVNVEPITQPIVSPASRFVPFPPRLVLGGASSLGRVRERNEDRFQTRQWNWNDAEGTHEVALIVVADGMGGYQGGDEASTLTVRTVVNQLSPVLIAAAPRPTSAAMTGAIDRAFRESNRVVAEQAKNDARFKEMGATAAIVVIWDGCAYFGHVGDCRVYLYRGSKLNQLTEDQTLVTRMVALGQLTAEEAAQHEARNEVTQAIGKRPILEPSRGDRALARGDYVVVACDGLVAHVDTATLQQVMSRPPVPPQHLASHLVSMADEGGGTDNCTVVVAHFD